MKKFKNKWFYFTSFLFYLVFVFMFAIFTLMFIEQNSRSFLISFFSANKRGSDDIVEVVIDDYSIKEYKLPWTADLYTEILDYFYTYAKPKVVGYDMIPASFDKNKPADLKFLAQISRMDNFVSAFIPQTGNSYVNKEQIKNFGDKFGLEVEDKINDPNSSYNDILITSDLLSAANKYYGSVLFQEAVSTGNIFDTINVIKIADKFYPSLSLRMYMLSNSTNKIILDPDYIIVPKTGLKIPYRYKDGGVTKTNIRFYDSYLPNSTYSHPSLSASRIIDTYRALKSGITPQNSPELYNPAAGGRYLNPELFKDKVIFIGANISGPSEDVHKTPMYERHPGVDIQATVYDNLNSAYFLHSADFSVFILSFVLLSVAALIIILRCRFIGGIFLILLTDIIYLLVVFISASKGYIMSYAVPLVCQLITAVFGYSFKFISENRNKEKIKQAMGKYLSQDIMKNVVSNIDDLKLGGKRAVVTVLFSDIRGFTSLSEKMPAEEVSMILNEYFAQMEPIISKYNGVINKFIGDAVMAIFGEPVQDLNHAQNAVKCAYEMLKKVEYLREKWLYEGKPRIEIGIGINTGEVFIGNIGTETRMEYTVIGDTVNLASRIEAYNKVYKTNLLISSSTYSHVADIADVIKISEVQIRGKAKKTDIYEVLRIDLK